MDKVAVIEINSTYIKMSFADVNINKTFNIYKEINLPINLAKDFYPDCIIKPAIIKEINSIILEFSKMIVAEGITKSFCIASPFLSVAKNVNSFLNELSNISGLEIEVIDGDKEISMLYTAIINTFNKPKSLIVNIDAFETEILLYNRRNVLQKFILPYGCENLTIKFDDSSYKNNEAKANDMKKCFADLITNEIKEVLTLPDEFEMIGCGSVFLNLGVLNRKATKYPLDIAHNYFVKKEDSEKVYSVIKQNDITKPSKLKGLSFAESKNILAGLSIVSAVFEASNATGVSISNTGIREGYLLNYALPLTLEKPISDTLGYSLSVIGDYFDKYNDKTNNIYELSMILFKQLKVLHKLSRPYIRVLRVASYLCNSGARISVNQREKNAFPVVINSDLYGINHNEIVMAGFVAQIKESDNFNLSDWVKYKELLTDDDVIAVKRLAAILKIAEALDITGFGNISDISCDILGDSVIMKTVSDCSVNLEIKAAMLCGSDFKKAFSKTLEVL